MTAIKDSELEMIEVENEGYVAAGRTVPFPAPDNASVISLPKSLIPLAKQGFIRTMTVHGTSLQGVGLYENDEVVVKKAFKKEEIKPQTICVVYIHNYGEILAKQLRFRGEHIILKSCHDSVPDFKVQAEDVEVRGIVIRLLRNPDDMGRFDRGYVSEFPF
jgi:SOS-response transcriptional repressor LexA